MIAMAENDDDQLKRLDFGAIVFPSDRLSIGTLRKVHPDLFDKGFNRGRMAQPQFFLYPGAELENLGNMLYCERDVAAHAYAKALGIKGPESNLASVVDELAIHYIRHGLASGTHHATEFVRDIESQALRLANQKSH
jgi:hypothetical protein